MVESYRLAPVRPWHNPRDARAGVPGIGAAWPPSRPQWSPIPAGSGGWNSSAREWSISFCAAALCDLAPLSPRFELSDAIVATIHGRRLRGAWQDAALATLDGRHRAAASIYEQIGSRPAEADSRFFAARSLAAEADLELANAELARCLAFWRSVGATAYVADAHQLQHAWLMADVERR
jgi:hypothetical protein